MIRKVNCNLSQSGCVNYAHADGSPAKIKGYGPYGYFSPELMFLSMNFMYEGQGDYGLSLLKRFGNLALKWGYTWDQLIPIKKWTADSGHLGRYYRT
jgi:hypothetical protein